MLLDSVVTHFLSMFTWLALIVCLLGALIGLLHGRIELIAPPILLGTMIVVFPAMLEIVLGTSQAPQSVALPPQPTIIEEPFDMPNWVWWLLGSIGGAIVCCISLGLLLDWQAARQKRIAAFQSAREQATWQGTVIHRPGYLQAKAFWYASAFGGVTKRILSIDNK